jgi:nucleotide-binding universal stress UspA family protein
MMKFEKILIAVDESTFAAHAADAGMDLALQLGAEVAFVTVVDTATITYDPNSDIPADEWLAILKGDAKKLLKAFSSRRAIAPAPLDFLEVGTNRKQRS